MGKYNEAELAKHERCEQWKADALNNCKVVNKIISKIEMTDFKFNKSCIVCEHCSNQKLKGGFYSKPEIVLCENALQSSEETKKILSHELVHLLDHRQNTNWDDVNALARSEIRAAKFSLDCHKEISIESLQSLERGGGELSQDFKNCVKHKAEMSVNVITGSPSIAKRVVEEMFDKSYNEPLYCPALNEKPSSHS